MREALTHGSATRLRGKRRRTNERLEFLGDRVVGLAVADLLIRRYPDESEGTLTSRLSGLVREPALAEAARELGLGAWLEVARSEEEAGGRERPGNPGGCPRGADGRRLPRRRLGGRGRHRAPLRRAAPRSHGRPAARRQDRLAGVDAEPRARPARVPRDQDLRPGARAPVRDRGLARRSRFGDGHRRLQARRRAGGGGGAARAPERTDRSRHDREPLEPDPLRFHRHPGRAERRQVDFAESSRRHQGVDRLAQGADHPAADPRHHGAGPGAAGVRRYPGHLHAVAGPSSGTRHGADRLAQRRGHRPPGARGRCAPRHRP